MSEIDENEGELLLCRSLESLSLGGVAAMTVQPKLPARYRKPRPGERSTYQGAGIVPVCRVGNGQAHVLVWQPQKGHKHGVRWYDFGGKKLDKTEFTSYCACRKFAKQTYGIFGCELGLEGIHIEKLQEHLGELYHGLANLPLMLKTSQDWAQMQLLNDDPRVFYNDIHEYHVYLLNVPYVPAEIFRKVSYIVDGGKRMFKWLSKEDFAHEVLAPRLHTASFSSHVVKLTDDPWVRYSESYGDGQVCPARGSFSATVVDSNGKRESKKGGN